jgi:predicted metal-binding transcription factor (methanogenesis marker protein 9)
MEMITLLTSELNRINQGCGEVHTNGRYTCMELQLCPICQAKLSTLKSTQEKFDKFKEDIKKETREWLSIEEFDSWCRKIDELSSKQEGKK